MKKLLIVALFVAIPALVLAQGTTTNAPAKPEVKKVESAPAAKAPEAKEAVKTEAKKVETATTTKTTEPAKTAATTEVKPAIPTPEMILIGEIDNVDTTNRYLTFKVKETNTKETIKFKELNPTLKSGVKGKIVYKKGPDGKLWLEKFEEHKIK